MTGAEILQMVVAVLVGGGVFGAAATIWTTRHRPAIDRQQANDATRKSYADTFKSEVDTMKEIIAEQRVEREQDRAAAAIRLANEEQARERLESRVTALSIRVDEAERHAARYRKKLDIAVDHISRLEWHINNRKPPPPPERPDL